MCVGGVAQFLASGSFEVPEKAILGTTTFYVCSRPSLYTNIALNET